MQVAEILQTVCAWLGFGIQMIEEYIALGSKEVPMRSQVFVCAAIITLVFAGSARSQFGIGYSVFSLDAASSTDDLEGVEMRVRFPLNQVKDGLQTNLAFNVGYYNGGDALEDPIWNLLTGTFGLELATHERLGESNFFIRPSISAGGTVAFYKNRVRILGDFFEEDEDAFGWMGQVGAVLGIEGNKNLGVEVSYGWHGIDFNDEADGTHNQFYIGLFLGY